jgi:hypothetical protein
MFIPLTESQSVRVPWWYHGLAWGWIAIERKSAIEPTVGWKGIHPQSIGRLEFDLKHISVSKCIW